MAAGDAAVTEMQDMMKQIVFTVKSLGEQLNLVSSRTIGAGNFDEIRAAFLDL